MKTQEGALELHHAFVLEPQRKAGGQQQREHPEHRQAAKQIGLDEALYHHHGQPRTRTHQRRRGEVARHLAHGEEQHAQGDVHHQGGLVARPLGGLALLLVLRLRRGLLLSLRLGGVVHGVSNQPGILSG
jgi:hypothetical protein